MDSNKVDMFIMSNSKYFESSSIPVIKDLLLKTDDSKWLEVQSLNMKDPTITIVLSLLAGSLGIDRFYLGEIGLGVVKLLTCGGLGIWLIVDWFLVMGRAKELNMEALQRVLLSNYGSTQQQ